MSAVVFVGPTLDAASVAGFLDAEVLPPVKQGDVYRAATNRPRAIGIIDGYFEGVPSVWHKEILWAIEQGIAVFGSASMGALRASELSDFGMIGVGGIYEAYSSGHIKDDDEVAVLHGPEELGFPTLSEPMVSIRGTVRRAVDAGILGSDEAEIVLGTAKSLYYHDRTWKAVQSGVGAELGGHRFFDWLQDGRVDAKRDDACEMLKAMRVFLQKDDQPQPSVQRVERTLVWDGLVRRVGAETQAHPADQGVLNELRLDPDRFFDTRERAALRMFARQNAGRSGAQADRSALLEQMSLHRARHGLARRSDILAWLERNDLDEAGYEDLLNGSACKKSLLERKSTELIPHILAELRWEGTYSELKARANAKDRMIEVNDGRDREHSGADKVRMLIWYFETVLESAVPEDLDAYAQSLGLAGREDLHELIAGEFLYCMGAGGSGQTAGKGPG